MRAMLSLALICVVVAPQVMSEGISDRIIGGHGTTIEKHPYQVYMTLSNGTATGHCGGSIISDLYILTAAHCFKFFTVKKITVKAGVTYLHEEGTNIPIGGASINEKFGKGDVHYDGDVAIIKMRTSSPIKFTNKIQPIALPDVGTPVKNGEVTTATGWGRIEDAYPIPPDQLQSVDLDVIDLDKCKKAYRNKVNHNMFCAGNYDQGGTGTCQGDSGGPVVTYPNGKAGKPMQVGIVSFGSSIECGLAGFPSVMAKVSAHEIRNFIKEKTGI